MEPIQQAPQVPTQEQPHQTASAYYKTHKRSFLFSRVTVMTSMLVLVIALAVNISVLYSQDRSTTQSHASTPENQKNLLPALHAGCHYQPVKEGFTVTCPSATPVATQSAVPINIILPKLPPQCGLQTTNTGTRIVCTNQHDPIPTVSVSIPPSCTATTQTNFVQCKVNQQSVTTPLPSLPAGCTYVKFQSQYFVKCDSQEKLLEKRGD